MNNGVGQGVCTWSWIDSGQVPMGTFFQLTWPAPVAVRSMYIDTENGTNPGPLCNHPTGRNIASGTVQWWNGLTWVTAATFSGMNDDFQLELLAPVTTTRLRLIDVTSGPGTGNAVLYEWHVYSVADCAPPP